MPAPSPGPAPEPPPIDPKPHEHQALRPVEPEPVPAPSPIDPKPYEHEALRPVEPEPTPSPSPGPAPEPPPIDPKPQEHQALRPVEPEPAPVPTPPVDPKPHEHQALRPAEPEPVPTPSPGPPPEASPIDPKPQEHQALRPAEPEPVPAPPPIDPKPYEHEALRPVEPEPLPAPPPIDPKPNEHLGLAPEAPPATGPSLGHPELPVVDPKPGEHQALRPPEFDDEPLPPSVTVEEPVEVAPLTPDNYFEPWTRVDMTEDEWRELEDEVLSEACPDGWERTVFGCSVAGLTLDEEGQLEPIEILESGVGSAIGRLARWVTRAKPLPSVGQALSNVTARLPLSVKNSLVSRGLIQSPASRLPTYAGGKTTGVVDFGFEEVTRISGRAGPALDIPTGTPGFNAYFRTHVEGHAVAEMIQRGIPRATVYINQAAPCAGTCMRMIPRALPAGYELRVVGSTGRVYVFTGGG